MLTQQKSMWISGMKLRGQNYRLRFMGDWFNKEAKKQLNQRKIVFSTNGPKTNLHSHMHKHEVGPHLTPHLKLVCTRIKTLSVSKLKLLESNVGINLPNSGLGNDFLNSILKQKEQNIYKNN